jgi:hypothetical protein
MTEIGKHRLRLSQSTSPEGDLAAGCCIQNENRLAALRDADDSSTRQTSSNGLWADQQVLNVNGSSGNEGEYSRVAEHPIRDGIPCKMRRGDGRAFGGDPLPLRWPRGCGMASEASNLFVKPFVSGDWFTELMKAGLNVIQTKGQPRCGYFKKVNRFTRANLSTRTCDARSHPQR